MLKKNIFLMVIQIFKYSFLFVINQYGSRYFSWLSNWILFFLTLKLVQLVLYLLSMDKYMLSPNLIVYTLGCKYEWQYYSSFEQHERFYSRCFVTQYWSSLDSLLFKVDTVLVLWEKEIYIYQTIIEQYMLSYWHKTVHIFFIVCSKLGDCVTGL